MLCRKIQSFDSLYWTENDAKYHQKIQKNAILSKLYRSEKTSDMYKLWMLNCDKVQDVPKSWILESEHALSLLNCDFLPHMVVFWTNQNAKNLRLKQIMTIK